MSGVVVPLKRKAEDDGYRCICGYDHDDGFSIACDSCQRWSHAACYDIVNGAVPEEWKCWSCNPRPVNREAAERLQRARQQRAKDGRRLSPGIDRKHRRIRHRELAETDEPSTHAFVPIAADIVHPDAREKLRRYAHHWRGITALADDDPAITPVPLPYLQPPPTTLKQLPPQSPLSPFTNPSVLPPAYAVHTAAPVRSHDFIAPFTSNVVPSSSYLADPLNAYAHLGMPKPFVHLIGPPFDLALDARQAGDNSRYLRSGCRPNAVLRPVLCPPDSLSFGVFASRDLKPNEEVILGWEWDDGNVVHSLPALIESPHAFPNQSSSQQVQHLRKQMADILHALSSNFTTCACGSQARDCVLNQMAAFVEDDRSKLLSPHTVDLGPLIGKRRGFRTRERVPSSSGMAGVEMSSECSSFSSLRKGKAKERPNGLIIHDQFTTHSALLSVPPPTAPPRMRRTSSNSASSSSDHHPLPQLDPPDEDEDRMPPKMRKRWKKQLRRIVSQSPADSLLSLGSTDEINIGLGIRMDDGTPIPSSSKVTLRDMPPPPLPATSHLTAIDVLSPSAGFSRLSIVEAIPSPYQPWTPFERKETIPTDTKMTVDVPHSSSSPSSRSPPASISISPRRSRSRSRSRSPRLPCHRHPSPTSTAITTPPSPRDSKLPDVPPPPPSSLSFEPAEPDEGLVQPPTDEEVIRDSPESPPPEPMDEPSSPMSPATPTPPPPPMLPPQAASPLEGKGLGKMEIEEEIIPKEVEDELEEGELLLPDDDPLLTLQYPSESPPPPSSWHSRKTTPPSSRPSFIDLTISPAGPSCTITESMNLLPNKVESVSPPPPPMPSIPKVKMSLKDFAARKKKQREENPSQVEKNESDGLNSPMVDSPVITPDSTINTSAAVMQAINSSGPGSMKDKLSKSTDPPLKFTPRVTTSTSLPVKLHSEMRHVGSSSSSTSTTSRNSKSSKPMFPPSSSTPSLPSTSTPTSSTPSSSLLAKSSAGSPSISMPPTSAPSISSMAIESTQKNSLWSAIAQSAQEKENKEKQRKEKEEQERKAKEERERKEKETEKLVFPILPLFLRRDPKDPHELKLDKLEEELKKEKEKMKQLVEARKKGEMETWEKLKLKSLLEGSTTTERPKAKQTVAERRAVSPPAALRPLVNSKLTVPPLVIPAVSSSQPSKGNEHTLKQPSLPPASPIPPTPSSSSSTTTAPPPRSSSVALPSLSTSSITSRSHSPTNLITKRPVPKSAPTAPRAIREMPGYPYPGVTPPTTHRLKPGFGGVTPPTGPRALKGTMSISTDVRRVIPYPGPAPLSASINTSTSPLPPPPSSAHPPQPNTSPPPQPPPPPSASNSHVFSPVNSNTLPAMPSSAVCAISSRRAASSTPPLQPPDSSSSNFKDTSRSGSVDCLRSAPSTTNPRLQAINTRIPATRNTSKSNTPNSSTPVTPTATPTPTSIPPSAGLPPRPPVAITTPSHHLHRDPLSSVMAMGMGISNSSGTSSAKRMGSDRGRYDRDRDRDRDWDRERSRSKEREREREKDWDHWTPRPRRDWDSWPRTTDKY